MWREEQRQFSRRRHSPRSTTHRRKTARRPLVFQGSSQSSYNDSSSLHGRLLLLLRLALPLCSPRPHREFAVGCLSGRGGHGGRSARWSWNPRSRFRSQRQRRRPSAWHLGSSSEAGLIPSPSPMASSRPLYALRHALRRHGIRPHGHMVHALRHALRRHGIRPTARPTATWYTPYGTPYGDMIYALRHALRRHGTRPTARPTAT